MSTLPHVLNGFARTLALYKQGEDVASFANTQTMPTFSTQAKWHFHKENNSIKLHNPTDDVVYHFSTPDGIAEHGASVAYRSADVKASEFPRAAHRAQVHRSDPGSVYFTVQDGTHNPTYTLRHVGGQKWHIEPKKKKVISPEISPEKFETVKTAILKQATPPWYDPVPYISKGINGTASAVGGLGVDPLMSLAGGAGVGVLYDQLKRNLYNTGEENQQETFMDRAKRVAIPALGAGGLGLALNTSLPNFYNK